MQNSVRSSSALLAGTQSITTTAAALTGGGVCIEIIVQSDHANTADILVGNSTVQSYRLPPGEDVLLPVNSTTLIYVKSKSGTQVVNWLARK
mgnify:CR=1 FL=1